jgi:hypothetical protein
VQKITLSPWLLGPVTRSVVKTIKKINGCAAIDIRPSSLLDNARWPKAIGLAGRAFSPGPDNTLFTWFLLNLG